MKKSNHFLFHAVLKSLKSSRIQNKHLLIGVSGGLDSITLLHVLLSISPILKLKISVLHVCHGSKNKKQRAFQNKALKVVQTFCQKNQLKCYSNGPLSSQLPLPYFKNEAEMRAFRYQIFLKYFKKSQADFLALAHTAEDLLETQILRLIRGTGPEGIRAIRFKRGKLLRPFIDISRSYIKSYAQKTKLKWCEDPSNQDTEYSLRNWVRKEWLPLLENKKPGALKAMARSLGLLANFVHKNQITIKNTAQALIKKDSINRKKLLLLSPSTRQTILAYYLRKQGFRDYSFNQIKELLKQLERKQKNFSVYLLGKTWDISVNWLTLKNHP